MIKVGKKLVLCAEHIGRIVHISLSANLATTWHLTGMYVLRHLVQNNFRVVPKKNGIYRRIVLPIDTISIIVGYYNIKCSSVWYHFDPITVYYKENISDNPNKTFHGIRGHN